MRGTMKTLFTLAVPLAAIAAGGIWMLGLGGTGKSSLVYDSQEVARGTIRKVVSSSGPVRALVTVSISSQLSGQIKEVLVDFNSEVKSGDVIATLDERTFASRVAQAKADLAAAQAQLSNQQAALQKAEATLKQAERASQRQQALASKGIAAQAAVDTSTRDMEVARADIAVSKAQIESAKATIAQRQAQLDQAQIDLNRARILSPIDGTVISRTVDVGQTVASSLQAPELFKIAQDLGRIRIEAQVNEADVGAVREGNPVTFAVDAYPELTFQGKVTQVRLAATELQNVVTYTVIIEARNVERRLFPGMTANVQIETAKKDGVLRIPNDATRFKPRGEMVSKATAAKGSGGSGGGSGGGYLRQVERLKSELNLTEQQESVLTEELKKMFAELRQAGKGEAAQQIDPGANRQRTQAKIEEVLVPLLSDEQRTAYVNWKRGRENTRFAQVWTLPENDVPVAKRVRLGISDDQFTEVLSGDLKEGDKVITRARESRK